MSEERFRELWAKVEHIGKIEHLSDDALLALGGIFGELKSKMNEQAERVQELEKQAPGIELELINGELADALEQNKRYREAIEFGIEYLKNSDIRQVQLVVTALKSALEESK